MTWNFPTNDVDLLGLVICLIRMEHKSHTANAICKLKSQANHLNLRYFLAKFSIFRRLLFSFTEIASPPNRCLIKTKLKKSLPLKRKERKRCKRSLSHKATIWSPSPLVLALAYFKAQLTLNSHARWIQVRCKHLRKEQSGTILPIKHWSKSAAKTGQHYNMTQRKCLAFVGSVFLLWFYFVKSFFTIRTNCGALKWVPHLAESTW